MIFARFFAKNTPQLSFTPDIPGDERARLLAELKACANREGGSLKTARRAQALSDLFPKLSPAGKQAFADMLGSLNDETRPATGDRYAEIEEAEYFGGSESKLALLDMFETPRRRVIGHLADADTGSETLKEIKGLSNDDVRTDIDEILTAAG
ncbi:MAG: hypothetical protein ACPGRZ_12580 [Alphaproteobacteria bacterium]